LRVREEDRGAEEIALFGHFGIAAERMEGTVDCLERGAFELARPLG
jgi:hypothetical protein